MFASMFEGYIMTFAFNFDDFKFLATHNMVEGLTSINNPRQLCEACILGEHH